MTIRIFFFKAPAFTHTSTDLDAGQALVVVVKSLELQSQKVGQPLQLEALGRVPLPVARLAVVLVMYV